MSKIKIAVVEDEIIIADNICSLLDELGYIALEPALNYTQAVNLITTNSPDLILIDIQLSGQKDGIDLAMFLKNEYKKVPFIFLTSNADIATISRAKLTNPSNYIIKPFSRESLYSSIEIALHNNIISKQKDESFIYVKQNQTYIKLFFSDIVFIKSEHVYIEIHTISQKTYLIRSSLNNYMSKLPSSFIRIHRSYAFNLQYLNHASNSTINVLGKEIPISKNYRSQLVNIMTATKT